MGYGPGEKVIRERHPLWTSTASWYALPVMPAGSDGHSGPPTHGTHPLMSCWSRRQTTGRSHGQAGSAQRRSKTNPSVAIGDLHVIEPKRHYRLRAMTRTDLSGQGLRLRVHLKDAEGRFMLTRVAETGRPQTSATWEHHRGQTRSRRLRNYRNGIPRCSTPIRCTWGAARCPSR
jgi:hypothetical protein